MSLFASEAYCAVECIWLIEQGVAQTNRTHAIDVIINSIVYVLCMKEYCAWLYLALWRRLLLSRAPWEGDHLWFSVHSLFILCSIMVGHNILSTCQYCDMRLDGYRLRFCIIVLSWYSVFVFFLVWKATSLYIHVHFLNTSITCFSPHSHYIHITNDNCPKIPRCSTKSCLLYCLNIDVFGQKK